MCSKIGAVDATEHGGIVHSTCVSLCSLTAQLAPPHTLTLGVPILRRAPVSTSVAPAAAVSGVAECRAGVSEAAVPKTHGDADIGVW
jgi:hypothetical protein